MLLNRIDLCIYSILVLLFLVIDLQKHTAKNNKTYLFLYVIYANIVILLAESVSWIVDGMPGGNGRIINYIANSFLYLLNLVPLSLWCSYFDECFILDKKKKLMRRKVYIAMNLLTAGLVLVNPFTGILFQINQQNVFERSLGAPLFAVSNYLMYIFYCISIIKYRKLITGRIYQVIICVAAFPAIGGYFQTKYYGVILVWPMATLVCLVAYILTEREEMNRDTVTQLPTRALLESRMKYKISRRQSFSIIMIDLDKFKSINDSYGHREGDEALSIISNLLQKSIKQVDQAYRYAGDEFVLLIETDDSLAITNVEERLYENLNRMNISSKKPYQLSFSYGSIHYDGSSEESIYHLLAEADKSMYFQKNEKAF